MKLFKGIMKREEYTPVKVLVTDGFDKEVCSYLKGIKADTPLMLAYADTDLSVDSVSSFLAEVASDYQMIELPEDYGSAVLFDLSGTTKQELLAELEKISVGHSLRLIVSAVLNKDDNVFEVLKSLVKDSDYRTITCNNSVIDSETVKRFDGSIPDDFFSCFFAFYNGIKVGDRQLVKYNLEEIKKCIVDMFAPDVFRLAYLNLVHCFSKYLSEECIERHIEDFPETVDEAFDIVGSLADKYFEKMFISGSNPEYLKREVLRIVENDFSDPLLSVTMLADRLGISNSYLSRYFKEKTGVTLFSYIDEIRIAKAKQLLIETDAPVKDIVHAVGYNDINNFNRKFKSKTGQTPSSYRRD